MFTIIDAGTNPLLDNHPVYVVYREDGSYWGMTRTTALVILVDGLAQEMGGRYLPAYPLYEPELPVLTVTEQDNGAWQAFIDGHESWVWPTVEHAVSSLRGFLLREYAPRR